MFAPSVSSCFHCALAFVFQPSNTLHNTRSFPQGDEDHKPDLCTAVLDNNAYDRKMGLCASKNAKNANSKPKGSGKVLGWSPDQVQVIVDDDDDEDEEPTIVGSDVQCGDDAQSAPVTTASAVSPGLHKSVAPSEKKERRKGILKSPSSALAAASCASMATAHVPESDALLESEAQLTPGADSSANRQVKVGGVPLAHAESRGGGGKPCFEFSQTGKCRRGGECVCAGVSLCLCLSVSVFVFVFVSVSVSVSASVTVIVSVFASVPVIVSVFVSVSVSVSVPRVCVCVSV